MEHSAIKDKGEDADDTEFRRLVQRGIEELGQGLVREGLLSFNLALSLRPAAHPYLWQRGIAYYYAGMYREGADQFRANAVVSPHDIEKALWLFLCTVRENRKQLQQARQILEKWSQLQDSPVPMEELLQFYLGKITEDEVLQAAIKEKDSLNKMERNKRLFHAHLYIALYHEVLGDHTQSLEHLQKAVSYPCKIYMWRIARFHLRQKQATSRY